MCQNSLLRVLYVHGLESGPGGYKVQQMRKQGLDVVSPEMQMSLYDVRARNSVLRNLLDPSMLLRHWPWQWLVGAGDASFAACVEVQKQALRDNGSFDVLVGSSWGGAVAATLVAEGAFDGPVVLLCPALGTRERWFGESLDPARTADAITASLAALPAARRAACLLVHGDADTTVPLADSSDLSKATGIALEVIKDGSHGLGSIVRDGRLVQFVQQTAALRTPRSSGAAGERLW